MSERTIIIIIGLCYFSTIIFSGWLLVTTMNRAVKRSPDNVKTASGTPLRYGNEPYDSKEWTGR